MNRVARVQHLPQQLLRENLLAGKAGQKRQHLYHILALAGDALAHKNRQRRAQAVRVFVQVFQCHALGADVAGAEHVGVVAAVAQTDGSPATLAGVGGLAAVGASTAAGVVSVSAAGGLSVVGLAVSEGAATMAAGGVLAARAPLTPGPTYIIGRRPGAFSVGAAAGVVTIGARRAWRPQR
mgnify:CR=1 FL=1